MIGLILISLFFLGIVSLFITNLWSYKSDEEVIIEYFKMKGKEILNIKNSSENQFRDKEKLKKIKAENRIKNLIIVSKSGPLLRNGFYSVTTSEGQKLELLITNSIFFFIKPKIYLDK